MNHLSLEFIQKLLSQQIITKALVSDTLNSLQIKMTIVAQYTLY